MNTSTQFGIGSFLAGFTQGFEKTQELKMKQQEMDLKQATLESEQAKLEATTQRENEKLKLEQQKRMDDEVKKANDSFEKAVLADAEGAVAKYNSDMTRSNANSAKYLITNTDGKQYVIDTTKDQKDSIGYINASILNNDGLYRLDGNTIVAKQQDGSYKPTSYIGTSIDNLVAQHELDKGSDLTKAYFEYKRNGGDMPMYEFKTKLFETDKRPVVNVMGTEQPIQVANEFGTYYADPKTGNPVTKNGTPLYKEMNAETKKTIESIDQSKRTVESLNNMLDIVNKNPKAIGSFGQDPINYIANYANDYLGIPTDTLTSRTQIQGTAGVLTAVTRKLYENGVMTDKDYARYEKIMPQANDNEEVFKNKAKVLIDGLNKNIKQTEDRYKEVIPLRKTNETINEPKTEVNPLLQENKKVEIKSNLTGSTVESLWKKIEEKRKQEGR